MSLCGQVWFGDRIEVCLKIAVPLLVKKEATRLTAESDERVEGENRRGVNDRPEDGRVSGSEKGSVIAGQR